MKIPETPFEFINIVLKEYSKFKNMSEDDVIDLFNKYGIFQYLHTYFDILKDDRRLFWKIEMRIEQEKSDEQEFLKNFENPLDKTEVL